jgi:hypothetical protein
MRRVGLVTGPLLALAAVLAAASPLRAAVDPGPATVDAAVQVTPDPGASRAHTAPVIAVHPKNDRIVALAEADALSGRCAVYVSTNAGLSWAATAAPPIPAEWPNCAFIPFGPVVDVAFGPDGTLYYAFSGFNPTTKQSRVFLARSADLGSTWDTTTLPWIAPNLDKGEAGVDSVPSIAVDPGNPKRVSVGWGSNWATYTLNANVLQGKLYYWDVVERVYVATSNDGGRTFGDPVNVGDGLKLTPTVEGVKPPPQVVAGNHGEIFAIFGEYARGGSRDVREGNAPPAHIYLATSHDGGRTYDKATIFTGPTPTATSDWTWVPRMGIDRHNGNLYAVWENMSASGDPVQISAIRSTDGGRSWSEPAKVNDAEWARKWNYPELYPSLSVAPDGRVDVAWYDWRNDPGLTTDAKKNVFQDVYYTSSTDGGLTWAPNLKLNDRAIDRHIGVSNQGGIRGPVGIGSRDEAAYVAWDDTRNGTEVTQSQDIYFTRARVADPAELFGAGGDDGSPVAWAAGGVAAGLAIAGLGLLAGNRLVRRRSDAAPAVDRVATGVG